MLSELVYDFESLANDNSTKYQSYLEEAFLDYISQVDIPTPYKNSEYSFHVLKGFGLIISPK